MYGATGCYAKYWCCNCGQLCSTLDKGEIICPHFLLVYIFGNNLNFAIWELVYEMNDVLTAINKKYIYYCLYWLNCTSVLIEAQLERRKDLFSFSLILVHPAITDNNINYKCHNSILYIILIGIWS